MDKQQALLLHFIADIFMDHMPYNQILGIKVVRFDHQGVEIRFPWKDEFIGNPMQKILHGGVTASVLDVVGGLMAIAGAVERFEISTEEQFREKLSSMGTIDLITDYLRPGRGKEFVATAEVIRTGNKVCVCRMELYNEEQLHIASGTGTYLVG